MAYHCSVCGEMHDDLPDLASDRPDLWWGVPERERKKRIKLTSDTCIIDGDYFIRGVLEIPVRDQPQPFGIGVWVSQKKENFWTYVKNSESSKIGPFFGWLCTRISFYPVSTLSLKTRAHFRGGKLRPVIEVEPTDHPLAVDQREGITLERAWEMVHSVAKR
jgi:hypothetical protein